MTFLRSGIFIWRARTRPTLSSRPAPAISTTSDEPPKLMNGSTAPVGGTSAVITAIFNSAFDTIHTVTPAASSAPNVSGARREV